VYIERQQAQAVYDLINLITHLDAYARKGGQLGAVLISSGFQF
jgi:hypothetical protein